MDLVTSFSATLGQMLSSGDWFEIALAIFTILIFAGVAGLILWGVFYAIDSWFVPEQQSRGVITGRSYSPAQMILVPITSGVPPNTTTIMMPQHIPESWSVGVRVGKRTGSMCVKESYYDRAERGQDVMVHYVSGRLSNKMYVKGLS